MAASFPDHDERRPIGRVRFPAACGDDRRHGKPHGLGPADLRPRFELVKDLGDKRNGDGAIHIPMRDQKGTRRNNVISFDIEKFRLSNNYPS